jgi:hypothetical protein
MFHGGIANIFPPVHSLSSAADGKLISQLSTQNDDLGKQKAKEAADLAKIAPKAKIKTTMFCELVKDDPSVSLKKPCIIVRTRMLIFTISPLLLSTCYRSLFHISAPDGKLVSQSPTWNSDSKSGGPPDLATLKAKPVKKWPKVGKSLFCGRMKAHLNLSLLLISGHLLYRNSGED